MTRVRARRRARSTVESLTGAERANLMVGRGVACDWSDSERRTAWDAVGDDLVTRSASLLRPAAWWEYAPGIPAALREPPECPQEARLAVLGVSTAARWPNDRIAGHREALRRRVAFLAKAGHLRPDEVKCLERAAGDPRHSDHITAMALLPLIHPHRAEPEGHTPTHRGAP